MHQDIAPIIAEAPARRLPATAAEAIAMYAISGPKTLADRVNLCRLINAEFQKIHWIMDNVISKLESDQSKDNSLEMTN